MILQAEDFQEIQKWVARNARPLDLALWRYHFNSGAFEDVASALLTYQNADGGFGHAIEPDSWNPESSPYATLYTVSLLMQTNCDKTHPVYQGALRYYNSGVHSSEIGWHFTIPSNNDAPHAPWWSFQNMPDPIESIGLTAEIVAFVFRFADKDSPLFERALGYADSLIRRLNGTQTLGEMGVGGYSLLLESIVEMQLENRFDVPMLSETIRKMVYSAIQRDPEKWVYYGRRPSDLIRSPESPYYAENASIVELELDYLIETRPKQGVWPITWSWFDLNDTYPKEFAISENWWRASKALEKVLFLRNFGRLTAIPSESLSN